MSRLYHYYTYFFILLCSYHNIDMTKKRELSLPEVLVLLLNLGMPKLVYIFT